MACVLQYLVTLRLMIRLIRQLIHLLIHLFIGDVTGTGVSTLGNAPNVSRQSHTQDIFVSAGGTLSITYVADGDCTLVPKRPRADMTFEHSNDGREITITWNVPADEPGDSTYIGVEAWVYGSVDAENVTQVWDRLHIGKVAGDVKVIGSGTPYPILFTGIQRPDLNPGDTVIINDGDYTDPLDVISVGFTRYPGGTANNYDTPNGVSTEFYTQPVYGSNSVIQTDGDGNNITEQYRKVSKFTTIMASTPLGVVLDRGNDRGSVTLKGNLRGGEGNRDLYGVKVKGVSHIHGPAEFIMEGCDSCAIEFCAHIMDTNPEDYLAVSVNGWLFGDGGHWITEATRGCYYESCMSIGNHRYGAVIGGTRSTSEAALSGENPSKHSAMKRMIHTGACIYSRAERITAGFNIYGARHVDRLNMLCVDSAFFEAGHRERYLTSTSFDNVLNEFSNASFLQVNNAGDDYYDEGLISLNTTSHGYRNEQQNSNMDNTAKNCVLWGKTGYLGGRPMVEATRAAFFNFTIGKNSRVNQSSVESCLLDSIDSDHNNHLMISGAWDYDYSSTDQTVANYFGSRADDNNWAIIPSSADNFFVTSQIEDLTLIEAENAKQSGAHYISRTEEGSTLRSLNVGCANVFATVGEGGAIRDEDTKNRYDGIGANQYVNWLSEIPWIEFRRERQKYSCLANGVTFTGGVGMAADKINPTDYINREGTTPGAPRSTPYIDNIYGKVVAPGSVTLWWRPICAPYRSTTTGYKVYIDNVLVTSAGNELARSATSVPLQNIDPGTRRFNIVVVDPVIGDSGFSNTITLTVT